MATCTNVPRMCRKEKQSPSGQDPRRGDPTQWGRDSLLLGPRAPLELRVALRMTSIHLQAEKKTFINPPTPRMQHHRSLKTSVPLKRVFTLWSEVVDVGLEMQLEDVVLVDVLGVWGNADRVTQQRKAGQGVIILQGTQVWCQPLIPHLFYCKTVKVSNTIAAK